MEKRLVVAFWAVLIGFSIWQTPEVLFNAFDDSPAVSVVVFDEADTDEIKRRQPREFTVTTPSDPSRLKEGRKNRVANVEPTEFKFDFSAYRRAKQKTSIFSTYRDGQKQVPFSEKRFFSYSKKTPGVSGLYDSAGDIVYPVDTRHLH